jgi:hypothetical protein
VRSFRNYRADFRAACPDIHLHLQGYGPGALAIFMEIERP